MPLTYRTALSRLALPAVLYIVSGGALAQTCDEPWTVRPGDSLSRIAEAVYGDFRKWSAIFTVNRDLLGDDPDHLDIGDRLHVPCLDAEAAPPAPADDDPGPGTPEDRNLVDRSAAEEAIVVLDRTAGTPVDDAAADDADAVTTGEDDRLVDGDGDVVDAVVPDDTTPGGIDAGASGAAQDDEAVGAEMGDDARSVAPAGPSRIDLLTADGYEPFTDRALPEGGLVNELVTAAMTANDVPGRVRTVWINDWSAHLEPLLTEHHFDLGFPWLKPDCTGDPENFRCREFLFSEPMFEFLVLLFTDDERPLAFDRDEDLHGTRLCRPAGYYTHDLDRGDRRWLSEGLIELVQPAEVDDCFRLLLEGGVDAVALNEFTGRTAVQRLGLDERVHAFDQRPLSIEGLHVLVHRRHPQAAALLERVNGGLEAIRRDGSLQRIVDEHLAAFWATLDDS